MLQLFTAKNSGATDRGSVTLEYSFVAITLVLLLAVLGDASQTAELMQGFADQGVERMAFLNAFGALPIEDNAESIRLLAKAALNVTLNPTSAAVS